MKDFINNLEIRVFSLRRSGHHAFISWIAENCSGNGCLLNLPRLDRNIFEDVGNSHLYPNNAIGKLDLKKERTGKFSKKDYLIYNLENRDLESLKNSIEKNHDENIGKSRHRHDVMMLRDPFNLFASSLKFFHRVPTIPFDLYLKRMTTLWKQYAREFLGITNHLTQNKIPVSFNRWFGSERERILIGEALGLTVKSNIPHYHPEFGGGSSFSTPGVLERWKYYSGSHIYKGLFDEEIWHLSNSIFGEIPGTAGFHPRKFSINRKNRIHFFNRLEKFPYIVSYYRKKMIKFSKKCFYPFIQQVKKIKQNHIRKKYAREKILKKLPKNAICAEIGVWKGNFSRKILDITHPKKLHLIDPWHHETAEIYKTAMYGGEVGSQEKMDEICHTIKKRFDAEIRSGIISIHRQHSKDAGKTFPDNYFDWIYIDGNHLYEYVSQDFKTYLPKIKKMGFLAGDDYTEGGWWQGGVKQRVDEIVATGKVKKVLIKNKQFLLKKTT